MSLHEAALPLDHIEAELLAAPFHDEAGLRAGLVALDPTLRQPGTAGLWRAVEQRVARSWPGVSLDEIITRRDRLWFGAPGSGATPLADILRRVGAHLARPRHEDGQATDVAIRRRLRWLTFALPSDLPAAAGYCGSPVVSPIVERLLAEGVVEPHLHLGAALDFETIWVTTQHALANGSSRAAMFASPGACFDEGRNLGAWLLGALIVRGLLARCLARWRVRSFDECMREALGALLPTDRMLLVTVLRSMRRGRLTGLPFARLRAAYRLLLGIGPGSAPLPSDLDEIPRADSIARWFPPAGGLSAETLFIRTALDALDAKWGSVST